MPPSDTWRGGTVKNIHYGILPIANIVPKKLKGNNNTKNLTTFHWQGSCIVDSVYC